ncbi:iron/copper transporter Atx1, partial [Histoplasma capsulatum]
RFSFHPHQNNNPAPPPKTLLETNLSPPKPQTGVKSYTVSLESQTATVFAEPSLEYDTVLSTIKKTGKTVNSGEADGVQRDV